jgi:hypothetical protein
MDPASLYDLASELAVVSGRSGMESIFLRPEVIRSSTLEASPNIILDVFNRGVMSRLTYPKDSCIRGCQILIDRRERY